MRPFAKPLWIFVLVFVENLPTMAAIIYAVITSNCLFQCRINANRGPWQLFSWAPLLTRDKNLSQPATRVDTTCWQLFRPDINTAHLYFLLQKLCQIRPTPLLTCWKKFSLLPEAPLKPEARGICHIYHMVNPALAYSDFPLINAVMLRRQTTLSNASEQIVEQW